MGLIAKIRDRVAANEFEFSQHAVDQSILRRISVDEIRQVISTGAVIEDYPQDKYGPSCLILGFTVAGRRLHVQCSYPTRPIVKIITVYDPDPSLWSPDLRERRRFTDDESR